MGTVNLSKVYCHWIAPTTIYTVVCSMGWVTWVFKRAGSPIERWSTFLPPVVVTTNNTQACSYDSVSFSGILSTCQPGEVQDKGRPEGLNLDKVQLGKKNTDV